MVAQLIHTWFIDCGLPAESSLPEEQTIDNYIRCMDVYVDGEFEPVTAHREHVSGKGERVFASIGFLSVPPGMYDTYEKRRDAIVEKGMRGIDALIEAYNAAAKQFKLKSAGTP